MKYLCLRQKTWYIVGAMIWGFTDVTISAFALVLLSGFVFDDFIKKLTIKYEKSTMKCLNDVIIC